MILFLICLAMASSMKAENSMKCRGIFEGNSINERIMAMATMAREGNKDCLYIGDEIIHVTDSYLEAFNGYVLRMQGMTK